VANLPTPGGSEGTWGAEYNAFLLESHDTTGKIKDGAVTTTDAAPTVDAGVANKKYVDDNTNLSAVVSTDSNNDAMLKDHAYLAQTDGVVRLEVTPTVVGQVSRGWIGTTTNPLSGDNIAFLSAVGTGTTQGFTFTVANGEYFEITTSAGTVIIKWLSNGTLLKPIDQD
jgi:hypothetical protein